MKYQLTVGMSTDGEMEFFRVYEWKDDRWLWLKSYAKETDARAFISRKLAQPEVPPERVIEEFA